MSLSSRLLAAALALAVLPIPSQMSAQAGQLTSPRQALGFDLGADYRLATYTQLMNHWQTLARESPRMVLDTMGLTAEGRPQLMAIISSPANIARREEYRKMAEDLGRGRIDSATARRYAQTGKSIMWIDGGLHATEVLGAAQLHEVVWQFVSRNDPETMRILDDVIILVAHANPDGQELVSSWYMRNPDSLRRNVGNLPRLYEKYAGHDNNRDSFRNALPETQNVSRTMYQRWYPQIMYNHHQTGPQGSVMFAPPFRDPFNYFFDPLVSTSLEIAGMMMHRRFAAEGKGGVVARDAAAYSTWWNGGLRTTAYFHNMIGILTETIGSPTPTTIPINLTLQLPSANGYYPAPWGTWRFRQSVDYSMTANRALLDWASRDKENLLFNFWRMARNSVERGQKDTWTHVPRMMDSARAVGGGTAGMASVLRDPNRRDPRAFVMRADQPEIGNVLSFLQALAWSGIEIHRATAAFTIAGKSYPKGSFIVRSDQAYRPHVLDMFERQDHPTDLQYPGGPPKRPYDVAGYTLAFQMGIDFDRILDTYTMPAATLLPMGTVTPEPAAFSAQSAGWRLSPKSTETFLAVNRLLAAGQTVNRLPSGDFIVPRTARSTEILGTLARDRAYQATPVTALSGTPVTHLRVGLINRYGGVMPVGWTHLMFENFETPFEFVYPKRLDEGNLKRDFDVLLFVSGQIPSATNVARGGPGTGRGGGQTGRGGVGAPGRGAGAAGAAGAGAGAAGPGRGAAAQGGDNLGIPAEYVDQLGSITQDATIPQLRAFVEAGGQIIAIGSSGTGLASQFGLPLENHLRKQNPDGSFSPLSQNEHYVAGSVLQMTVDTTQPIAFGALPRTDVFVSGSPVWRFGPGAEAAGLKKIGWYASDNVTRSGWVEGPQYLKDGVVAVSARIGQGTVYLYAPEFTFRHQPHGTFRFLFNAFYGTR